MVDYYKILEIPFGSSQTDIKKAYKKLVHRYHPDLHLNQQNLYEEKMKNINEAYEILSDIEKRKQYDIHYQYHEGSSNDNFYKSNSKTGRKMNDFTGMNNKTKSKSKYRWEDIRNNTSSYDNNEKFEIRFNDKIPFILSLPFILICSVIYFPYLILVGIALLFVRYYFVDWNSSLKRRTDITIGVCLFITIIYLSYSLLF